MSAVLFESNDASYTKWLTEHPNGFVLNVRKQNDPEYAVLHTATCSSITESTSISPNPFTGRGYRKLVSGDVGELRNWIRRELRADDAFSKLCGLCKPGP